MRLKVPLLSVFFLFYLQASSNDSITLQLKWRHQFQFAGYYAAQLQGFYAKAGLSVTIREGNSSLGPIKEVLTGKADYGIADASLLINHVHGDPVIALGAVFQHSPYVILSDSKSNIHSPSDLIGKTIMASEDQGWAQLEAMLLKEGIPRGAVNIIPHSWNIDDLSTGKVDGQTAYVSVESNYLKSKGIEPSVLKFQNYGVDFYGDILFTTLQRLKDHPEEVEKFRSASFLGWQYAMQHPEELADYILTLPGVKERGTTKEMLLAEYEEMNKLILSGVIEAGHMNPGRWEHILDTYKSLKLVPASASIEGFVYDPVKTEKSRLFQLLFFTGVAIVIVLLLSIGGVYIQRRQKRATEQKLKKSEEHLELAVNSGGIGIWDWDIQNDNVFFSNTWKTMLGYEPTELENRSKVFFEMLHPDEKLPFKKKLDDVIEGKSDYLSEIVRLKTKSGSWKWILTQSKAQARNKEGVVTHLAGIHLDMDELKKKEQELLRITDELMRMNTGLQQFAFVTSHNLRAPAVNMLGLLRIVDYAQLSDMNKDIHRKLEFSTNVLINTLKDLNDILTAKKETEQAKETIVIPERFESLVSIYSEEIKNTGAQIQTNFAAVKTLKFPVTIFDSIITNLLSNALKFRSESRKPQISISSGQDNKYVFIKFKDNGRGIDLHLQGEKIFKLYQRFHERTEGKGMGLYIIKVQLENLGGKITVESTPDEGAEFTVWFRKELEN